LVGAHRAHTVELDPPMPWVKSDSRHPRSVAFAACLGGIIPSIVSIFVGGASLGHIPALAWTLRTQAPTRKRASRPFAGPHPGRHRASARPTPWRPAVAPAGVRTAGPEAICAAPLNDNRRFMRTRKNDPMHAASIHSYTPRHPAPLKPSAVRHHLGSRWRGRQGALEWLVALIDRPAYRQTNRFTEGPPLGH
jgi:hypothetical protein